MQKKLLMFLDIDGTLIQPSQRVNSSVVPKLIHSLGRAGVLFGLNSNRAFEDILPIYRRFGLNGPIIAENGVYFKTDVRAPRRFLISYHPRLALLGSSFIRSFVHTEAPMCEFRLTDTVQAIRMRTTYALACGIFMNQFRLYSGSVHIFKHGERDRTLGLRLASFLRKSFAERHMDIKVEVSPAFGNILFYPRATNKGHALRAIKKLYPQYDLAMVGDDLGDLAVRPYVKYFFAVGNAHPRLKRSADYVARGGYTQGVAEILRHVRRLTITR